MKYTLSKTEAEAGSPPKKASAAAAVAKLWPLMAEEKGALLQGSLAIVVTSALSLLGPYVLGKAIDSALPKGDFPLLLRYCAVLVGIYLGALAAGYLQTKIMGGVGQRVLLRLRNAIFTKLTSLPVAFFNANKAGDLISRINNDTDKLNMFFSQTINQFIGNIFIMLGAGAVMVGISPKLGLATLGPALLLLAFTRLTAAWVRAKNAGSLKALGSLSGEIQESLTNFKVVIAFNRRDYFRQRFSAANQQQYAASLSAGLANAVFTPLYTFCSSMAQVVVLAYGISLIRDGQFTLGLLISFLTYANQFYSPLRHMAALWTSFQTALAGWDRVSEILEMESDLPVIEAHGETSASLLEFRRVHFRYSEDREVLHGVNFALQKGKTYAFVGPTGGGKTTTASLMARLFDPTEGTILLEGKDIRSYQPAERTQAVGFILQEPFLFAGTVRDNMFYGNEKFLGTSKEQLDARIAEAGFAGLLARFEKGADTDVAAAGDSLSLGQKQIIAFMRAVLREPKLLILDEATANIDTVTEKVLEEILSKLPQETTRVVIAHRLNTIESADEIFFVNGGGVVQAGSLDHAVEMLLKGKRGS